MRFRTLMIKLYSLAIGNSNHGCTTTNSDTWALQVPINREELKLKNIGIMMHP